MTTPHTLAAEVIERVGRRAAAQVTVSTSTQGLTRFANSHIHQHVGERTTSVVLKVETDGRVAAASTTDVTELGALVDRVLALAAVSPTDPQWPGLAPPAPIDDLGHVDEATAHALPDQRAAIVRDFVEAGAGLRAAGYCETLHVVAAFANSAGHAGTSGATRATIDGIHQTSTSAGQGHASSRGIGDLDGVAAGAHAAHLARAGEHGRDLAPGRYEVVLSPEAAGTLSLFLGAYGFNAKAVAEGRSFVRLGEARFDPALRLTDDVRHPASVGIAFDAEGTPRQSVTLVADGRCVALTHDRRTAAAAGTTSTGHAMPGGETFGPAPMDLVLGGGDTEAAQLVAGISRGLLVTAFNYCRVLDPKTLVVTGLTRNGTFLIEDGEIAAPLSNLRFTQSFVDALGPGQVLGIGRDQRYVESEFGPGLAIAPSLRLAQWNVTGGAAG